MDLICFSFFVHHSFKSFLHTLRRLWWESLCLTWRCFTSMPTLPPWPLFLYWKGLPLLNSTAHGQRLLSHWVPCSHIADFTSMAEPLMKVKVKVAQSCLTLYDPVDYTVPGILQARIREWAAFPSSRGSSQPRDWTQVSYIAGGSLPAEPQGEP